MSKDYIGKSRAKCAVEYLQELNADVSGHFIDEVWNMWNQKKVLFSCLCLKTTMWKKQPLVFFCIKDPSDLATNNPDFFTEFSVVIATGLSER